MDFALLVQKIVILTPPILLAVTVHEMAHGWAAYRLGDPTARVLGRLTLNPLKHLDPAGTLVFFVTQTIGWAKPVPVNPLNFREPRKGMIWVALAGPVSNILLAAVSAMVLRHVSELINPFQSSAGYFLKPLLYMAYVSVQINLGLAVFNLIPIPPLDGSKVLAGLLPRNMAAAYEAFERYGFLVLLLLVFTGATGRIIVPLVVYLNNFLLGSL